MAQSGIRVNVRNNLPEVERRIGSATTECLDKLGLFLVSQAKLRCPVDTGNLRSSIGYKVSRFLFFKHKLILYARASYSIFVHEGSRGRRPRRFLLDAILENKMQVTSFIQSYFRSRF